MFHKRKSQIFPEGTFLPKGPRTLAILQLCLAFTALCFILSKPFMEQHFTIKSRMLLYDYVMKKNQIEFFNQLPESKKEMVLKGFENLQASGSLSFFEKLKNSFDLLLFKTPSFERAWILFGIIIPILLLKKIEGAPYAALILPLITIAYLSHNQWIKNQKPLNEETKLFPKEEFLVDRYLKTAIKDLPIAKQQKELLKAWNLYLVEDFAKEPPAKDSLIFQKQISKGEFAFNLARIEALSPLEKIKNAPEKKISLLAALSYLIWNLLFPLPFLKKTTK